MLQSYKRIAPGKSLDTLNVAQETNPAKTNPTNILFIRDENVSYIKNQKFKKIKIFTKFDKIYSITYHIRSIG